MATTRAGPRVLVVEDSGLIAHKIEELLGRAGYEVVGPAPTLRHGLSLLQDGLSAAVLDIDLRGQAVYPLAERLWDLGTPFMFLTGFLELGIPDTWKGVPRLEKPFDDYVLLDAVAQLITGLSTAGPTHMSRPRFWPSREVSVIRQSRNVVMESRILRENTSEFVRLARKRQRQGQC
jgi:DNA-binding response OmpR family regulator